jgi:hypothetical protein
MILSVNDAYEYCLALASFMVAIVPIPVGVCVMMTKNGYRIMTNTRS